MGGAVKMEIKNQIKDLKMKEESGLTFVSSCDEEISLSQGDLRIKLFDDLFEAEREQEIRELIAEIKNE